VREAQYKDMTLRITGGTDGNGGGSGPVVVLLHGFGAPGDDLVPLARALGLAREVRFVFPAAPLALPSMFMESRAWWLIDFAGREQRRGPDGVLDLSADIPDGLDRARGQVSDILAHLDAILGGPVNDVILGGFSQGAMLALDTYLHDIPAIKGLVLMSPTLVNGQSWQARLATLSGLPLFVSHGRQDEVLAFPMTERLLALLQQGQAQVSWTPFDGGHEIPMTVLKGVNGFLTELT